MGKAIGEAGLSALIAKIKAWGAAMFLAKSDVEEVSVIAVDTVPVAGSGNLITSGGVRAALDGAHVTLSVTLPAAGWAESSITVSAEGVTAASTVVISPAPESMEVCSAARVYCSAQGSGSLTFSCASAPTADIVMNVIMLD